MEKNTKFTSSMKTKTSRRIKRRTRAVQPLKCVAPLTMVHGSSTLTLQIGRSSHRQPGQPRTGNRASKATSSSTRVTQILRIRSRTNNVVKQTYAKKMIPLPNKSFRMPSCSTFSNRQSREAKTSSSLIPMCQARS